MAFSRLAAHRVRARASVIHTARSIVPYLSGELRVGRVTSRAAPCNENGPLRAQLRVDLFAVLDERPDSEVGDGTKRTPKWSVENE